MQTPKEEHDKDTTMIGDISEGMTEFWVHSEVASTPSRYALSSASGCWQGLNPRWEDEC
jgi:hypothetical protein